MPRVLMMSRRLSSNLSVYNDIMFNPFQQNEIRIILVGKTGIGISRTADAILGKQQLEYNSFEAKSESTIRFGTHITIMNTPVLYSTNDVKEINDQIKTEINANHVHSAIFYTIYQKMTEGDSNYIELLTRQMHSAMHRRLFLVHTDCDDGIDNLSPISTLPVLRINSTLRDNLEAEYQIKALIRKIKLTEQTLEINHAIFSPRIHSSRIVLIFLIVLSYSVKSNSTDTNQVVHWKLMTKPVVFGKDVDLECVIRTESTSGPMAWIRIPNGETIAFNNQPADIKKYGIAVDYDDDKMVYHLTIRQFSSTDVNREYRCDFGFHSFADKLLLNNRDFISKPSKNDVRSKFNLDGETLIGSVNIENCFPQPLCTGMFKGRIITDFMKMTISNTSIFYETYIEIKYGTDSCGGSINITCTYGDNTLSIYDTVGDCLDASNSRPQVVLISIGISITVITAVAVGVCACYLKRYRRRTSQSEETINDNESVPMTEHNIQEEREHLELESSNPATIYRVC